MTKVRDAEIGGVAPPDIASIGTTWLFPALQLLLIFAVASLPLWPGTNDFILAVVVRALLFIMLGQAWNVIAGIGGQLSLGHGVFFGVGAYVTAFLFNELGLTPWIGAWIGVGLAVLVALLMGVSTLRLRGVYFALATVAVSLGFEKIARHLSSITGGDAGLALHFLGDAAAAMQFRSPAPFLWINLVVVVVFYALTVWLLRHSFGLRLQAVRDDQEAAAASGVNVLATKLIGLSLSAAMTSIAGTLHVQFYLAIDPATAFGLFQAIQIQLPSLIGGLGTAAGPVIGGTIMILISESTNWASTKLGLQGVDVLVYGSVLLLVVLYAPAGIVGAVRGWQARRAPAKGGGQ